MMIVPTLALVLAAGPPAGEAFAVDPAASTVRYHVVHKLHVVDARSSRIEGKAVLQPDGKVLAMVRLPVSSFDSGDGNRDAHMQEVLETGKFPFVVFKGVARVDRSALAAASRPLPVQVRMAGELELHGVRKAVEVPVTLEFRPDGTVAVHGSFEVSLDAYAIQRPSLLFVKVDDGCRIDLDLVAREVKS
jgi:polyisoprenoid-binding protein YceI